MIDFDWEYYTESWRKSASAPSGNYTSNLPFDPELLDILMENHVSFEELENSLDIYEIEFPDLGLSVGSNIGLNILAGLQNLFISDCITVYRAIRFPTPKRMIIMLKETGISTLNYEHQRLLKIYQDADYIKKRESLKKDPRFNFQPQERIVPGMPIFFNANDAIQIHRAYRNDIDLIVIGVAYLPYNLVRRDQIEIYSNYALVKNYGDSDGDRKIHYFKTMQNGRYLPFYKALNMEGNLVYESYCKGIPWSLEESAALGIKQQFFLLELYKPSINVNEKSIEEIKLTKEIMSSNNNFLYGFWGDDNIFMRRTSEFLPKKCFEIQSK